MSRCCSERNVRRIRCNRQEDAIRRAHMGHAYAQYRIARWSRVPSTFSAVRDTNRDARDGDLQICHTVKLKLPTFKSPVTA